MNTWEYTIILLNQVVVVIFLFEEQGEGYGIDRLYPTMSSVGW